MAENGHLLHIIHFDDEQAGLDRFHMSIAKVTAEYDRACKLVSARESNQLCGPSDLQHEVDGPNDCNSFSTFVENVSCTIRFEIFLRIACTMSLNPMKLYPAPVSRMIAKSFVDRTVGPSFVLFL